MFVWFGGGSFLEVCGFVWLSFFPLRWALLEGFVQGLLV